MTIENAKYPITDWQYEVANGDTVLGYKEWLSHKLEADGIMHIADAVEIVLELARGNIPDDPELSAEADKYRMACDLVEDYAVNYLGED